MNLYFDTEFTGLVPGTTLISIGMVSEDGRQFYAEFTDYNKRLCDDWIKENVISKLIFLEPEKGKKEIWGKALKDAGIEDGEDDLFVRGSSNYICDKLSEWLSEFDEEKYGHIQLVSDVCHYDMTLLCNLFGGAFKLPENVNPVCYDICQDLMNYYADDTAGIYYNCEDYTMRKAFDASREKFLGEEELDKKHNSLHDAWAIKKIYERLRKL